MKINLVGQSYQERSLPFDAQRSVNLYPVIDQQGKEVLALYGTPGLTLFGSVGSSAIRGVFSSANGRSFAVGGSNLYELNSDGTSSELGSLDNSSGNLSIDENGFQLAICDGVKLYLFTYATNVFAKVTDPDLPNAKTVVFVDGYFIVNQESAGTFYISTLFDGSSWSALDFATAESRPDELLRCYSASGYLWLLGTNTTEIWSNTGDSDFPFQRLTGSTIEVGIIAPHTAVEVENTLVWLGGNKKGGGIVYIASGFQPQRISTHAIELIIQNSSNQEDIRAYTYQEDGHTFYVLTGGGLPASLVYDFITQSWHERAYLNSSGNYEQHLGCCYMYAFGKHILGDRRNGNIYEMSMDYYDDAGDEIGRERVYTHIIDEDNRIRYNRLVIGVESGVGLQSGQGSNPLISLQLSKDGARTWSDSYSVGVGAVGKYKTKAVFRRLGIAEQMTFRIKMSDPVKWALVGSYIK